MSILTVTKSAASELLRQSIFRGTPGKIYLYLQKDNFDEAWMYIRVKAANEIDEPIGITDGITIFAPTSQINLLKGLTLDHYQDLTGGGFLISTPEKCIRSDCGSGFKLDNA